MNDILQSIIVGIVLFLAMCGLLRIYEINSDILDYCQPKGFLGWGYKCDVVYYDIHPINITNLNITFVSNLTIIDD